MVKRNLCKMPLILAALALSLAMFLTSCDNPANGGDSGGGGGITVQSTEGRLVIDGLTDFVGKSYRIFAIGRSTDPDHALFAGERRGVTGSRNNPMYRSVYIDADTVTLYLWKVDGVGHRLLRFTSGLEPDEFQALIVSRDISGLESEAIDISTPPDFFVAAGTLSSISTDNYTVSGSFTAVD